MKFILYTSPSSSSSSSFTSSCSSSTLSRLYILEYILCPHFAAVARNSASLTCWKAELQLCSHPCLHVFTDISQPVQQNIYRSIQDILGYLRTRKSKQEVFQEYSQWVGASVVFFSTPHAFADGWALETIWGKELWWRQPLSPWWTPWCEAYLFRKQGWDDMSIWVVPVGVYVYMSSRYFEQKLLCTYKYSIYNNYIYIYIYQTYTYIIPCFLYTTLYINVWLKLWFICHYLD